MHGLLYARAGAGRQVRWSMRPMTFDDDALRAAARALSECLRSEADQQNAYLFNFPDGRVSLELEWIDLQPIAQQVIASYLQGLDRSSME